MESPSVQDDLKYMTGPPAARLVDQQLGRELRIAVLLHSLQPGGSQQRVVWLINRLVELGQSVDLLLIRAQGELISELDARVSVHVLAMQRGTPRGMRSWLTAIAIARYIRRSAPDLLMSGVNLTHAVAVRGRSLAGRSPPLVLRLCSKPKLWPRSLSPRSIARRLWGSDEELYGRADAFIAVSQSTADDFRRIKSIGRRPIEVIYNPTATEALLRRPLAGKPSGYTPVILGIGRLQRVKDFPTLIRAFQIVRARRSARLILIGDGKRRHDLKALVRELGLTDDVEFPGWSRDVPGYIEQADLVVSSSLWEGLPATLIEALALGRPVVATDCPGGTREILAGGRFGTLVPMGDAVAMADAILDALDAPVDPQALRLGALPFAEEGKAEAYLRVFRNCSGRLPLSAES